MTDPPSIPQPGAAPAEYQQWQSEARDRRAAELEAWDERNRRVWRYGLLQIIVLEWCAVLLMLWSFSTSSEAAGQLAFWSALGLGDGGFLVIFVRTWRAAEGGAGAS